MKDRKKHITTPTLKSKLPDPPLEVLDLPPVLPKIPQAEIVAATNAHRRYQIAQADFEGKRAALRLKLLSLCEPEPGDYSAKLAEDGSVIITDSCSEGEPDSQKLV
ncbi:MAG: hypothetical protein ABSF46_32095 [Terriglobia bacterium]|jgi:hypothetical protein